VESQWSRGESNPRAGSQKALNLSQKRTRSVSGGAKSGALSGDSGSMGASGLSQPGPRLARVIESWPDLPEAVRAGIAAMVESTLNTNGDRHGH
jgi:hypothetical protein